MAEPAGPDMRLRAPLPDEPAPSDPDNNLHQPAHIRNLYVAASAYDAFTLTDGALRLVVLLYADSLGFSAIEIAVMFTLYEVMHQKTCA